MRTDRRLSHRHRGSAGRGAASIGYVNKPGKAECLNNAGATVTIADMHDLADAIHRIHDPSRGA
nr:hypothetical protein [Actinocatenispora sera]